MLLKGLHNMIHICLSLLVFCLHRCQFVHILLEESEKAFLFFTRIKILQFSDNACDHITHFTKVFRPHILQCLF